MEQRGARAAAYQQGLTAFCSLARSYVYAGRFDDAITLLRGLEAALVLPDVPAGARAELALGLADALLWQGSLVRCASLQAATAAAEQAVAAALSTGDQGTLARALLARARAAYHRATQAGEATLDAASEDAGEALRWADAAGDQESAAAACLLTGLIAERAGRLREAEQLFRRVLAEAEQRGYARERAEALRHLGFAAVRAGLLEQAEEYFGDSLAALQGLGVGYALPFAHLALGEALGARGQADAARRQLEAGAALAETGGNRRALMQILVALAEQRAGEPAAARALLERALASASALGHPQGEALIAARLGALGA
jgi:tetratricopeptide (TPR) repeat protein